MSYSKSITFETGSNGDAATTTNVQADSLLETGGAGTMTISTAEHHSGTRSLHCTGTSTTGNYCATDNLGGLATFTRDFWIKLAALPSAETTIGRLLDSTPTAQASLAINGLGALVLRNAAGTSVFASASGKRLTAGAWFHVIWDAAYGTSGTQRVRLYDSTGTAIDDSTVLTSNNGANLFDAHRRGPKAGSTNATIDFYLDDITLSGTSADTASAGPDQTVEPFTTVTLDGTGSSGAGTWSLVSTTGPGAPTLSDATAAQPTYLCRGTWHTGHVDTWRYTVGSSTDDVVINVNPSTRGVITDPATNTVQAYDRRVVGS